MNHPVVVGMLDTQPNVLKLGMEEARHTHSVLRVVHAVGMSAQSVEGQKLGIDRLGQVVERCGEHTGREQDGGGGGLGGRSTQMRTVQPPSVIDQVATSFMGSPIHSSLQDLLRARQG